MASLGGHRAAKRAAPKSAGDFVDALQARLADVSSHAVIDLGNGCTALDFSDMELKPDHERRPFWVTPTGSVFLEGASRGGLRRGGACLVWARGGPMQPTL